MSDLGLSGAFPWTVCRRSDGLTRQYASLRAMPRQIFCFSIPLFYLLRHSPRGTIAATRLGFPSSRSFQQIAITARRSRSEDRVQHLRVGAEVFRDPRFSILYSDQTDGRGVPLRQPDAASSFQSCPQRLSGMIPEVVTKAFPPRRNQKPRSLFSSEASLKSSFR